MKLVKTKSVGLPVTLSEIKTHLRIDGNDEDSYLTFLALVASAYFEKNTGLTILDTTFTQRAEILGDEIILESDNALSIGKVEYYNSVGDLTLFDSANYYLYQYSNPNTIRLKIGKNWPSTSIIENPFLIEFICGHGASVPDLIKQTILIIIGHYFNNREGVSGGTLMEVPLTITHLINLHRNWRI